MNRISHVFFDAAWTLFGVRGSVGQVYADAALPYGFAVGPAVIEVRFRTAFAAAPPMAFPGADPEELSRLEKEWWFSLMREAFEPLGPFEDFDAYCRDVFELFRGKRGWVVYPDVQPALAELRRQGLQLGVISNFDSRLYDVLDALGLREYFDTVTISSRVGAAKPDGQIFEAALGQAGAAAAMSLHVGDDPRQDCAGAQAAGMNAVLVDRAGRNRNAQWRRIESLSDLLAAGRANAQ
ncbi:MAG: HAD-IA family hydrolase [Acidobacteriota bacterium]